MFCPNLSPIDDIWPFLSPYRYRFPAVFPVLFWLLVLNLALILDLGDTHILLSLVHLAHIWLLVIPLALIWFLLMALTLFSIWWCTLVTIRRRILPTLIFNPEEECCRSVSLPLHDGLGFGMRLGLRLNRWR